MNMRETMFRGAVLIGNFSDTTVWRVDVTTIFMGYNLS
jgi:hypothetical protein